MLLLGLGEALTGDTEIGGDQYWEYWDRGRLLLGIPGDAITGILVCAGAVTGDTGVNNVITGRSQYVVVRLLVYTGTSACCCWCILVPVETVTRDTGSDECCNWELLVPVDVVTGDTGVW